MWQTIRSSVFGRHSHEHAYAAIVLSGGYEEAGDQGRFLVKAGDVVLHDRFEAHINRFAGVGAVVLNLRLPVGTSFVPGLASVEDSDAIVRVAERDQIEAANLLLSLVTTLRSDCADWPDGLAAALVKNPSTNLSRWSEHEGITPWAVSRGFRQVFGLSPSAFRARTRTRHAWKAIETSKEPLGKIAAHFGFADQPHMTRSIKALTGHSPALLRSRANRFKTA